MKIELTDEEADIIEDVLLLYVNDICQDMKTYSNDPENIDFYVRFLKTLNNFQEQLHDERVRWNNG